jgi:hypothetical protein
MLRIGRSGELVIAFACAERFRWWEAESDEEMRARFRAAREAAAMGASRADAPQAPTANAEIDTLVLDLMRRGATPGLSAYKASEQLGCPMPNEEQIARYRKAWALLQRPEGSA